MPFDTNGQGVFDCKRLFLGGAAFVKTSGSQYVNTQKVCYDEQRSKKPSCFAVSREKLDMQENSFSLEVVLAGRHAHLFSHWVNKGRLHHGRAAMENLIVRASFSWMDASY